MDNRILVISFILGFCLLSCGDDSNPEAPGKMPHITSITPTTAKIGDVITISGDNFQAAQGTSFVSFNSLKATTYLGWGDAEITVQVPTGANSGKLSVTVEALKSNENDFTLSTSVIDEAVTIGTQVWKTKNLDVEQYRNGDTIPQVKDSTQWANLKTGAWCYYNNDAATGAIYGKLYNWHSVNDARGLAPAGWHVASSAEWSTLIRYVGGGSVAGGKLKEAGTTHWSSPNTSASNENGFSALPGGSRGSSASYLGIGTDGIWWTSTESVSTSAMSTYLMYNYAIVLSHAGYKEFGFSVRCVKD